MSLPAEYLDRHTPPEVVVTASARPRITDPTLGVPLGRPGPDVPVVPERPKHALVTIGDSLTHGVSSGAVFRPETSWPAMVAQALRAPICAPGYGGPLDGLPLNLESILRQLQKQFGTTLSALDVLRLPRALHRLVDANEDYWERGPGSAPARTDLRYTNVGIYGWDLRDALSSTARRSAEKIVGNPPRDDLFGAIPENDNHIAALSVLAPFGRQSAQLDAVASHGRDGGIDTLVVALGSNNALDSVVSKRVCWSGDDFADLDAKERYTVWNPVHFEPEYAELVQRLRTVPARRVVLMTVPHVTVAPIAKGVNPAAPGRKWREGSRYFPYYVDFWIDEADFRPDKHRHLTHQQARAVDSAIDQYNDVVAGHVRRARADGRDWYLLDLSGILDGVAYRRFLDDPATSRNNPWIRYDLPEVFSDLDTRLFRSDAGGRTQGGFFGLDAVHPTTCGYAVMAGAVVDVLRVAGVAVDDLDYSAIRATDTLISHPPALFENVLQLIAPFMTRAVH